MGKHFNQALENYLAFLEIERGLSSGTVEGYNQDLSLLGKFLSSEIFSGENWTLEDIKGSHLRSFLQYAYRKRKNKTAALNRKIAAISGFFQFICREPEYSLEENPALNLSRRKEEKKLPQYLTLEEAGKLLQTIKKKSWFPERDYAIFALFLQTGCRLSELAGLEINQLYLEEGYVLFRGKGAKERTVPLAESTKIALREWLALRKPSTETSRVFLNRYGKPMGKRGIQTNLKKFLKQAGLNRPGLSVHKLRHTCFTLLLQSGVNIKTLKEIAGHTSISTTEIYTHITGEEIVENMKKHPLLREDAIKYRSFPGNRGYLGKRRNKGR